MSAGGGGTSGYDTRGDGSTQYGGLAAAGGGPSLAPQYDNNPGATGLDGGVGQAIGAIAALPALAVGIPEIATQLAGYVESAAGAGATYISDNPIAGIAIAKDAIKGNIGGLASDLGVGDYLPSDLTDAIGGLKGILGGVGGAAAKPASSAVNNVNPANQIYSTNNSVLVYSMLAVAGVLAFLIIKRRK